LLQENPSKGGNPTDENLNLRKLESILESPIDLVFGISIDLKRCSLFKSIIANIIFEKLK